MVNTVLAGGVPLWFGLADDGSVLVVTGPRAESFSPLSRLTDARLDEVFWVFVG